MSELTAIERYEIERGRAFPYAEAFDQVKAAIPEIERWEITPDRVYTDSQGNTQLLGSSVTFYLKNGRAVQQPMSPFEQEGHFPTIVRAPAPVESIAQAVAEMMKDTR